MSSTHDRDMLVTVRVIVYDRDVIDRVVNNHDGWQETYYRMTTEAEVLDHLAYNAIVNGIEQVNRLHGWADLPLNAAIMWVHEVEEA